MFKNFIFFVAECCEIVLPSCVDMMIVNNLKTHNDVKDEEVTYKLSNPRAGKTDRLWGQCYKTTAVIFHGKLLQ